MRATRYSWLAGSLLLAVFVICSFRPPITLAAEDPQTAYVSGQVLDKETGEPLAFPQIQFRKVTKGDPFGEPVGGALGGSDGTFVNKIKPGNYTFLVTYIYYQPDTLSGYFVAPGDTVHIVARLTPESAASKTIDVVRVRGEIIRTAEGSMIKKIQDGATVTDAITAERMSKGTDSNAAEALERVTGVTKVGGNVYVRGLGERYSQTQVNGVAVGTPEPNKRVVPLDIFPAGVLDNVIIQKTYTPDLDGEFAGSVIKLNTKEFAKNEFRQSLSLGMTQYSENTFWNYSGGSLDAFGFDDGTRALPDVVGKERVDLQHYTKEELVQKGLAFENVWTPGQGGSKPNFSYSALLSRRTALFGKKSGILVTASLSNSSSSTSKENNIYSGGALLNPLRLYHVRESETDVLGGLSATMGVELSENNQIKLSGLYTRQANDKVKISQGMNFDRERPARETELIYVERGLLSGVIDGTHEGLPLDSKLEWRVGLSKATRDEPDRRKTVYEDRNNNGTFSANGAGSQYPLTRIFGDAQDDDRSYQADWTLPFGDEESEGQPRFQMGVARRTKDRSSEFRRFGFTTRLKPFDQPFPNLNQPAEDLTSRDNLENNIYTLEELSLKNDSYTADQAVSATYGMVELNVLPRFRLLTGARYEKSTQSVDATSPHAPPGNPPVRIERTDYDLLPSANLTWSPTGKMNVRWAYARTVNRPELREISPFFGYDYTTGYAETGDTNLVKAKIDNYDIRWEVYPRPGELFSMALFYKDFTDPIQKSLAPSTGNYAIRPKNGEKAELYGFETELRLSFHSVWKVLDWMLETGEVPGFAGNWSFVANYSRVESEVTLKDGTSLRTNPFEGQAEYSANLGVFYNKGRWDGSVLYKSFGRRLSFFGLGTDVPDVYEYPAKGVDLTLNYRFSGATKLKFAVENLLSDSPVFRQGPKITQSYDEGMTFAVSFSYEAAASDE